MSELPPSWAELTLGSLTATTRPICYGVLKPGPYEPTGVPLLRIQDLVGNRVAESGFHYISRDLDEQFARSRLRGEEVLISIQGTIGRAAIAPRSLAGANISRTLALVEPDESYLDRRLLYFYFQLLAGRKEFETGGSTRASLNISALRKLTVPIPPLNEQRRIVTEIEEQLSRLDAAEASFYRVRRTLDVLRAAVLTAATAGLHTEELGSLVTDLRYGTSMKCAYESAGVPVLRIPNVQAGRIDTSDLKFAADPSVDLSPFMVSPDDLLFVRTNGSRKLIGRVAAVGSVGGMAFASYLIRARLKRSAIEPRFAAYALSTPSQRALIEAKAATTAGQYNLNLAALRSLPVPLPPLDEQRRIVAEVERQLSLVDALAAGVDSALRRSAALRRAILARAFRGELVPQNPDDEPASTLLDRIAVERAASAQSRRKHAPLRR